MQGQTQSYYIHDSAQYFAANKMIKELETEKYNKYSSHLKASKK